MFALRQCDDVVVKRVAKRSERLRRKARRNGTAKRSFRCQAGGEVPNDLEFRPGRIMRRKDQGYGDRGRGSERVLYECEPRQRRREGRRAVGR